jgi:hypothetical protein
MGHGIPSLDLPRSASRVIVLLHNMRLPLLGRKKPNCAGQITSMIDFPTDRHRVWYGLCSS